MERTSRHIQKCWIQPYPGEEGAKVTGKVLSSGSAGSTFQGVFFGMERFGIQWEGDDLLGKHHVLG